MSTINGKLKRNEAMSEAMSRNEAMSPGNESIVSQN